MWSSYLWPAVEGCVYITQFCIVWKHNYCLHRFTRRNLYGQVWFNARFHCNSFHLSPQTVNFSKLWLIRQRKAELGVLFFIKRNMFLYHHCRLYCTSSLAPHTLLTHCSVINRRLETMQGCSFWFPLVTNSDIALCKYL